jgi:hypothetical protein
MEKATKQVLGEELRKRYQAPSHLPEAMEALLETLRNEPNAPPEQDPDRSPGKKSDLPDSTS